MTHSVTRETVEQRAARLVRDEVLVCLSSLVADLAGAYADAGTARLNELAEQAFELASPIEDGRSAAEEAGWVSISGEQLAMRRLAQPGEDEGPVLCREDIGGESYFVAECPADACEEDGLEPHLREVFEHWAVTDWFARKLEAAGEKVDHDFAGMAVWARTTTGRMIAADAVVERIAKALLAD